MTISWVCLSLDAISFIFVDNKVIPCIFVGYEDAEYGYTLLDLENRKKIKTRDVV